MGKQSTRVLKRKAKQLLDLFPDKFTDDFEHNKNVLKELHIFDYSKKDRNIVAGIITREIQMRKTAEI